MKKIILLITITSLLLGCSNSGNTSSTNNGNSFTNSMDYEFTITINGEVHKIKGNTTNGIPGSSGNSSLNYINNGCSVGNYVSTQKLLMLIINDVTASNFISGQNLECQIILPNLLLGVNQAQVNFRGSYFDLLCTNLGAYSIGGGLGISDFQTVSGVSNSTFKKLPINISDLGTTTTYFAVPNITYNYGETLKGNYSGTVYLPNKTNGNYTIPVQLSIDFKALRSY
jgi:hypothetical protein